MFGRKNPREAGFILDGQNVIASTRQCVHCGMHWVPQTGSGIRRGFCIKCMGPLCGKWECLRRCIPFEKRLELIEKGLLTELP